MMKLRCHIRSTESTSNAHKYIMVYRGIVRQGIKTFDRLRISTSTKATYVFNIVFRTLLAFYKRQIVTSHQVREFHPYAINFRNFIKRSRKQEGHSTTSSGSR